LVVIVAAATVRVHAAHVDDDGAGVINGRVATPIQWRSSQTDTPTDVVIRELHQRLQHETGECLVAVEFPVVSADQLR
jgi:hypothetical protein